MKKSSYKKGIGKESVFVENLGDGVVKCTACYHHCVLERSQRGICGIRHNFKGKLYSLVNCRPCSVALDPIEKKPLYHFFPGTTIFSIGTVGCNMRCDFCQNWTISQTPKGSKYDIEDVVRKLQGIKLDPEDAVRRALRNGCNSIAYTYNEPTVFADFILDTAKLAASKGVKNVLVTNGYQSSESIMALSPYIHACNIDLKSFSNVFYSKLTGVRINPILRNIRTWVELGVWVEVTTLIIPGENDSDDELEKIARYLVDIDPKIVWHLSAYYDAFRMSGKGNTPVKSLKKAFMIGKKAGLKYIYLGNVSSQQHSTTFCASCGQQMVTRGHWGRGGKILGAMKGGRCKKCQEVVPGWWSDDVVHTLRKPPQDLLERQRIVNNAAKVKMFDPMNIEGRRTVRILFASQTGVCENYSKSLQQVAQRMGVKADVDVVDLETFDETTLASEDFVIIVTSTFFYGRIPRNGHRFMEYIRTLARSVDKDHSFEWNRKKGEERGNIDGTTGKLSKVKFAVFGIGSTGTKPEHLATYQVIAKEIDEIFSMLGAKRICKMGEGNKRKNFTQSLELWKKVIWQAVNRELK